MTLLSGYTDDELLDRITDLDHRREYVAELIRRAREETKEQCAAEIESHAYCYSPTVRRCGVSSCSCEQCAAAIRKL